MIHISNDQDRMIMKQGDDDWTDDWTNDDAIIRSADQFLINGKTFTP